MYAALSYADTIKTRCVCDADALVTSPVSDGVPVGECTDNTPPMAACSNQTVTFNGQNSIALVASQLVTTTDNCIVLDTLLSSSAITCIQLGQVIPVTVTAKDASNNSSTCISQIT